MKAIRALVAGLAVAAAGAATLVSALSDPNANDVNTLNFALQLEQFELDLYTKGYAQFSATDYANAGIPSSVRDYVGLIVSHEQAHVNFLTSTITTAYGATASQNCAASGQPGYSYGTALNNVQNFLATAITVEGVGVSAYVGALNTLSNTGAQQAAATIATVEARHTSFLRAYAGTSGNTVPFPNTEDPAFNATTVLAAAGPFFANCPYNFTANLPVIRPSGVSSGTAPRASFVATSPTPSSNPTYTQAQFDQDNAIFQYALTLEHLEADFYTYFYQRFQASDYNNVATVNGQGAAVLSNIGLVQAHEAAHVSAIQGLLTSRGVTPVTAGCYNWSSITDAKTFLTFAAILENTGVSAYDGAANGITDTTLQQIAASVATVEARHAAYLNTLNGQNASVLSYENGNFDEPLNMTQIVNAVTSTLSPTYVSALTGGCPNSGNSGSSSTGGGNPGVTSQLVNIVTMPNLDSFSASALNTYAAGVINQIKNVYSGTTFVSVSGAANSARRLLAVGTVTTTASIPTSDNIATIINNIRNVVTNFTSASLAPVSSSSGGNSASTSSAPNGGGDGAASTIGAGIATLALAFASVLLL